ncbi:MAG: transcriptional repressor [Aestuariivirga sp.]|uniref:iron response transcriptional regulator IrrA n=1 Tax=Aestuariivirga sp. TaxID=2650926 RepID=UPI0025B81A95|nr:Fur family transcriptional regulator [Aestuariivirga sp.]MCA3562184.1 transcriptional repressor [Aestuariivirga sp.]
MNLQHTALVERLRLAGLRPTRQRLCLAAILFGAGDRHVSAESLHQEALAARIDVSLATVYNTLNQFKAAGLLREVAFEGDRTFFDTNTSNHFHYYIEETNSLVDIGTENLEVLGLPQLPPGTEIDRVDIIIRLRKSSR